MKTITHRFKTLDKPQTQETRRKQHPRQIYSNYLKGSDRIIKTEKKYIMYNDKLVFANTEARKDGEQHFQSIERKKTVHL